MPQAHVMRLFLALGLHVPALPSPDIHKEVVIDAHCRRHNQGLDVYLRAGAHHASAPAPLAATEFRARVVWYPDLSNGVAHGRPPLSSPPFSKMHRATRGGAPGAQCYSSDFPWVTLFGLQTVALKDGRCTPVPTAAIVEPAPGLPLQLQVFLYDQWSWWQVARTEADGRLEPDVKAGEVAPYAPFYVPTRTAAPPAALPDPLPLRLALRACGNPDLRGPTWDTEVPSAPPLASAAATGGKGPPAMTSTTTSKPPPLEAERLPPPPLPRSPALVSQPRVGPLEAVGRAAESAIQYSATVRHVQHIVACVGALYDMYSRDLGFRYGPATGHWTLTGRRCTWEYPVQHTTSNQAVPTAAASGRPLKGPHQVRVATASTTSKRQPKPRRLGNRPGSANKRDAENDEKGAVVRKGGSGGRRSPMPTGCSVRGATSDSISLPPHLLLPPGRTAVAVHIQVLSLLLQLVLGPVVAVAVWRRRKVLMSAAEQVAASTERLLREEYDWLMTATPAGVKLHAELCALLGTAEHFILRVAAAAGRRGWQRCGAAVVGLLAAGSAVGGLGAFLAILHDLLLLASSPITLQAVLGDILIRRHLAWLKTAWRLMRGKQRTGRHGGRKILPPPTPALVPLEAGTRESRGAAAHGRSNLSKVEAKEAISHDPADRQHHIWTQQNPQTRVSANRHLKEEQQQQQQSVAVSAAEVAVQGTPGVEAHERRMDSLSGLLRLQGSLAASGVQPVQGPLMPISRLESLLGLAPAPGSDDEVVVEQLIVGVLLLVPLLALLPTTAAWHLQAMAAWGVAAMARYGLVLAMRALRDNVLLALTWRALQPLDFAGPEVMIHNVHEGTRASQFKAAPNGICRSETANSDVQCDTSNSRSGLIFLVEPLPLSWRSLTGAWLARKLRGHQVQSNQERERNGARSWLALGTL